MMTCVKVPIFEYNQFEVPNSRHPTSAAIDFLHSKSPLVPAYEEYKIRLNNFSEVMGLT